VVSLRRLTGVGLGKDIVGTGVEGGSVGGVGRRLIAAEESCAPG
jgi:hypothetical protein